MLSMPAQKGPGVVQNYGTTMHSKPDYLVLRGNSGVGLHGVRCCEESGQGMSKYPEIDAVLAGESEGCIVCGDCLEVMIAIPERAVEIAITDPPYGIKMSNGVGVPTSAPVREYDGDWDAKRPQKQVFDRIRKVSLEQVIFGGNYFADMLPPSPSWISWDKDNGDVPFADVELAWTSHKRAARKVKWRWHGMIQEHGGQHKEEIHIRRDICITSLNSAKTQERRSLSQTLRET